MKDSASESMQTTLMQAKHDMQNSPKTQNDVGNWPVEGSVLAI